MRARAAAPVRIPSVIGVPSIVLGRARAPARAGAQSAIGRNSAARAEGAGIRAAQSAPMVGSRAGGLREPGSVGRGAQREARIAPTTASSASIRISALAGAEVRARLRAGAGLSFHFIPGLNPASPHRPATRISQFCTAAAPLPRPEQPHRHLNAACSLESNSRHRWSSQSNATR